MGRLSSFSETVDTEIKGWLNPQDPTEAAKIAKACIALRNNNGGQLIFGFDDKTLQKSTLNIPENVRETYHPDVIQKIVSKFALPKFDVEVQFEEKDGQEHAIVLVKHGVESPVISKSGQEKVLRQNAVYMRTLSNNTVSSSEPTTPDDWERLIRTCFDNREANIGRFFRRHLQGIKAEMEKIPSTPATERIFNEVSKESPSEKNRPSSFSAEKLLDQGKLRFDERISELTTAGKIPKITLHGIREASAIIHGDIKEPSIANVLDQIFVRQPRFTGWPPWVDSRSFADEIARPYVTKGGWEALIVESDSGWDKEQFDFWRIEPTGKFYCARSLEDDTAKSLREKGSAPGKLLDFYLLISRTAEIIGTAKAFAEALAINPSTTSIDFAFRWTGLKGRKLSSWAEPRRSLFSGIQAEDSEIKSTCSLTLDTPQSAIWQSVKTVIRPVFEVFGKEMGDSVIEEITDATFSRSY